MSYYEREKLIRICRNFLRREAGRLYEGRDWFVWLGVNKDDGLDRYAHFYVFDADILRDEVAYVVEYYRGAHEEKGHWFVARDDGPGKYRFILKYFANSKVHCDVEVEADSLFDAIMHLRMNEGYPYVTGRI